MSDPNNDDPFAAFEDRTLIKPSAAGRLPVAPRGAAPPPAAAAALPAPCRQAPGAGPDHRQPEPAGGLPPCRCWRPRRASATWRSHPNPAALKAALAERRAAPSRPRRAGAACRNEQVMAGRYILCTLLDEAAASTPWGGSGAWAAQSLLVQFHNESWGGEKVFQLLAKLAETCPRQPQRCWSCCTCALAFGFEGRYRVHRQRPRAARRRACAPGADAAPGPRPRPRAVAALAGRAGPAERASGAGRAAVGGGGAGRRRCCWSPTWGCASGINWPRRTDAVFAGLQSLRQSRCRCAVAAPTRATPAPRLAGSAGGRDQAAGRVRVRDLATNARWWSSVAMRCSPPAAPRSRTRALVLRIGAALQAHARLRCCHRPHRQPADPLGCASRPTGTCRRRAPRPSAGCWPAVSSPPACAPKAGPTPTPWPTTPPRPAARATAASR